MDYGLAATLKQIKKAMDYQTVKKWLYSEKKRVHENSAKYLGVGHASPLKSSAPTDHPVLIEPNTDRNYQDE
ncbi:MAG: hypothetical protein HN580_22215 [Deltaproteobacteria bacterium]|jgi:hypothetical protein|nr:hypothetical protein [Deltaproteobacteria bacterium]MBT4263320.1 hypothetical protein [Deltaproteobacteria bacterium]MBT4641552.1 hypothetical protein [Deltaproteobacteria bacterium]MBT6504680.1 hypothetical protein [Deltaproteobacteria bacterium]MBT6611331.1 hypothetical protein [Deltaproteobacteria bacterium]